LAKPVINYQLEMIKKRYLVMHICLNSWLQFSLKIFFTCTTSQPWGIYTLHEWLLDDLTLEYDDDDDDRFDLCAQWMFCISRVLITLVDDTLSPLVMLHELKSENFIITRKIWRFV
jgi:hypothetical protein